ncbi:MAG: alpha/beta fold hydrolase [Planctomycetota bacterium]|nr:alpha/beta fold hydrolase [Planctomycetota bacterium]MDA1141274.1 alpha/beta fold hydrolase [Planctomycetota bacterium]
MPREIIGGLPLLVYLPIVIACLLVVGFLVFGATRAARVKANIEEYEKRIDFDSLGYVKGREGFMRMGGEPAVLLIHGFRGSPSVFEELGELLHQRGCSVHAMLLPGHGRSVGDLAASRWQNWASAVELTHLKLRERHDRIFLVGFSLGGLLALHQATRSLVNGVVAISPFLKLNSDASGGLSPQTRLKLAQLLPFTQVVELHREPNLLDDRLRAEVKISPFYPVKTMQSMVEFAESIGDSLNAIRCPLLIQQSKNDRVVCGTSVQQLYEAVSSDDKRLTWYEGSAHELLLDCERRAVMDEVVGFIQERAG